MVDRILRNTNEAAGYVGLKQRTLEKKRREGSGPVFLKLGGRVLYDQQDLDAWLASCRRTSTSATDPAAQRTAV